MKLAFLGAGKMATAFARGLLARQVCTAADLAASDVKAEARAQFSARTGVACSDDNAALVAAADAVLLAVKPQDAQTVLRPLASALTDKLLISICAGLSLAKLGAWAGTGRVIRVMPNTPAMVNQGASVFACGPAVTAADRELARRILGAVGVVYELPEAQLDAVTGLSGSGPAYVFEFVQALVEAGVAVGLDRAVAHDLVLHTVCGAAEMLRQKMGTPDELRQAVTSPNGTTAAGLKVLSDAEFRALLSRVVQRATERSRELGRG